MPDSRRTRFRIHRENYFFDPSQMESSRLDANIAMIKGEWQGPLLRSGASSLPFGPAAMDGDRRCGFAARRRTAERWIKTPMLSRRRIDHPQGSISKARLEGDVEGKLILTYTGLEAVSARGALRHEDDQQRKKYLEDMRQELHLGRRRSRVGKPIPTGTVRPGNDR